MSIVLQSAAWGENDFELTKPGKVYLQSLPFSRIAGRNIAGFRCQTGEQKGLAGPGGKILGDIISGG
jgi:hypothetical protein